MTKNDIRELLEYDAWATRQLIEAAATVGSTAAWTHDLNGTPLTSLRQQLVHLVITVDTYRALLQGKEPPRSAPKRSPNLSLLLPSMRRSASA